MNEYRVRSLRESLTDELAGLLSLTYFHQGSLRHSVGAGIVCVDAGVARLGIDSNVLFSLSCGPVYTPRDCLTTYVASRGVCGWTKTQTSSIKDGKVGDGHNQSSELCNDDNLIQMM